MDILLENIIELIGQKRGAQKKLAEYLGIHPNVITNWKNKTNKSYRGYVSEISKFYNVTEAYLLGKEQKEKPIVHKSAARQKLDALVDKMNDEQIMRLIEMIEAAKQL